MRFDMVTVIMSPWSCAFCTSSGISLMDLMLPVFASWIRIVLPLVVMYISFSFQLDWIVIEAIVSQMRLS